MNKKIIKENNKVLEEEKRFWKRISEMVLTELLDGLCSRGQYLHQAVLLIVNDLRHNNKVEIIHQTRRLFAEALAFYRQRQDKIIV